MADLESLDEKDFIDLLRALVAKVRKGNRIPLRVLIDHLADEAETLQMCADDGEEY